MAQVQELTESTFDAEVLKAEAPVLVDFWASWCGPCRMVAPVVEAIAENYAGKVKVGKVNVDQEAALATKYGIRTIPTLLVFKGGQPAERTVGVQSEDAIASLLDKVLAG
ncbi:thioredoxin [bacterium]|nr:thioredoxin [bacterium]